MQISVKPDKSFNKLVMQCITEELNRALNAAVHEIDKRVSESIENTIKQNSFYKMLLTAEFAANFGIHESMLESKFDKIIDVLKKDVVTVLKKIAFSGLTLRGGLTIKAIEEDWSKVLGLPEASYISVNARGDSHPVNWLDWIMIQGNTIVVQDYDIKFNLSPAEAIYSRSGDALMKHTGGFWRVPVYYQGTQDYNWVHRAVLEGNSQINDVIGTIIQEEIQKAI